MNDLIHTICSSSTFSTSNSLRLSIANTCPKSLSSLPMLFLFCLDTILQATRKANVRAIVTTVYSQTHLLTMLSLFAGSKFQKLVLNNVATNVPGRNPSVTAAMTCMSALLLKDSLATLVLSLFSYAASFEILIFISFCFCDSCANLRLFWLSFWAVREYT